MPEVTSQSLVAGKCFLWITSTTPDLPSTFIRSPTPFLVSGGLFSQSDNPSHQATHTKCLPREAFLVSHAPNEPMEQQVLDYPSIEDESKGSGFED